MIRKMVKKGYLMNFYKRYLNNSRTFYKDKHSKKLLKLFILIFWPNYLKKCSKSQVLIFKN